MHTVRLSVVAAANGVARLKVDEKRYRVLVGEEFAGEYTLLSLRDGRCGTVRHDDERFDLCEGEEYLVR